MRPSAALFLLLLTSMFAAPASAAPTADVEETVDEVRIETRSYTAIVDKPMGNLRGVWLPDGRRILGADRGMVQGVSILWNDTLGANHAQSDFRTEASPTITVSGARVLVENAVFREEYRFLDDLIEVRVEVKTDQLLRTNDLHVYVGSEVVPPNRQINDQNTPTYRELGLRDYTTDFQTDQSLGITSLVSFQARDQKPERFEAIKLPGRTSTWFRSTGHVWIENGPLEKVGATLPVALPHWEGAHFFNNVKFVGTPKNAKGDDVIIVHGAHGYQRGDVIHKTIRFDDRGYEVRPLTYPVRTDNETNAGNATGRLVVPSYPPPPGGYRLLMANHGNTGNAYDNTFMWDFLANDGYIVAASNYTSNAGPGFRDSDFGYNQQVEIEDLRRYVLERYPIDRERQYAAGLSLGGLNTFLAAINHPDVYAAIVPQSPVYNGTLISTILSSSARPGTYTFAVGNPKDRTDQLATPTLIICGTNDLDAYLLVNSQEAQRDHPDIELRIVPNAGHELWTWQAFRKEAARFFEEHPRGALVGDTVKGRFVGAITGQVPGFRDNGMRLDHANEWVRFGPLGNDTFTRIVAERRAGNVSLHVDRPTIVQLLRPDAWFADPGIRIEGGGANVSWTKGQVWLDGQTMNVLEWLAQPGTAYTASYVAVPAPPEPGRTPTPGLPILVLVVLVAVAFIRRSSP